MKRAKRRRNTYRLQGHDYADSTHACFVTVNTKITTVEANSLVDPDAPFSSCRPLGKQADESIHYFRQQGKWLVFAYCLMPDHLHMLVAPQQGSNLSSLLGGYQSYITRFAWKFGVVGKLWQRSFFDHILRKSDDAQGIVAYILHNPVEAKLVERWEDWPWCGTPDPL